MLDKEMSYFINTFIEKYKRERCMSLFNKRNREATNKFMLGLPRWIRDSCEHFHANATGHYRRAIQGYEGFSATVTDLFQDVRIMRFGDYHPPYFHDELIICSEARLAFFFHHHGGIWICRA